MYYRQTTLGIEREGPFEWVQKNPLISSLIAICVLSNIAALVCFAWEVSLHPNSFNWVPLVLTFGMFWAPQLTARGRKNKSPHTKNYYDIAFVLYGAITHWVCSYSVGHSGDSYFGCDWPEKEWNCDMGHPGIYGAFFFGIASITGHAFGWEKISKQRMARNWVGTDDYDKNNDVHIQQIKEFKAQVDYGTVISFFTGLLSFIFGIIHLVGEDELTQDLIINKKWGIGALYVCILVVTFFKWKTMRDEIYEPWVEEYVAPYNQVHFAKNEKSLLLSVVNITLYVWLTGALWYLVGLGEDNYWWYVLSAIFASGLAFWQHFHI